MENFGICYLNNELIIQNEYIRASVILVRLNWTGKEMYGIELVNKRTYEVEIERFIKQTGELNMNSLRIQETSVEGSKLSLARNPPPFLH